MSHLLVDDQHIHGVNVVHAGQQALLYNVGDRVRTRGSVVADKRRTGL